MQEIYITVTKHWYIKHCDLQASSVNLQQTLCCIIVPVIPTLFLLETSLLISKLVDDEAIPTSRATLLATLEGVYLEENAVLAKTFSLKLIAPMMIWMYETR